MVIYGLVLHYETEDNRQMGDDYLGPSRTILDNFGQFWTIFGNLDHFRQFWPFFIIFHNFDHFDHFSPFWTILDHLEPFGTILDHFDHFDHFWPFLTIFDHFWPFLTIFNKFLAFFFWILNFLIQNFFPVVLTPADLWYHAWFPRYCQSALFVTKQ